MKIRKDTFQLAVCGDCGEMYLLSISGHLCTLRREAHQMSGRSDILGLCHCKTFHSTTLLCTTLHCTRLHKFPLNCTLQFGAHWSTHYGALECTPKTKLYCNLLHSNVPHFTTSCNAFYRNELLLSNVYLEAVHCLFLMASEHCSMKVWLLFMMSQVIASEKSVHRNDLFQTRCQKPVIIFVWFIMESLTRCKIRNSHCHYPLKLSFKWRFKIVW